MPVRRRAGGPGSANLGVARGGAGRRGTALRGVLPAGGGGCHDAQDLEQDLREQLAELGARQARVRAPIDRRAFDKADPAAHRELKPHVLAQRCGERRLRLEDLSARRSRWL